MAMADGEEWIQSSPLYRNLILRKTYSQINIINGKSMTCIALNFWYPNPILVIEYLLEAEKQRRIWCQNKRMLMSNGCAINTTEHCFLLNTMSTCVCGCLLRNDNGHIWCLYIARQDEHHFSCNWISKLIFPHSKNQRIQ